MRFRLRDQGMHFPHLLLERATKQKWLELIQKLSFYIVNIYIFLGRHESNFLKVIVYFYPKDWVKSLKIKHEIELS